MPSTVKRHSFAKQEWQVILKSPEYMLNSIDVLAGTFSFLHTSRNKLSETSFIDGREPLSSSPLIVLPIEDLLQWQLTQNSQKGINRYLFHQSFCCSTLMARIIDVEGKSFSYKEPQILIELAELKAAQNSYYRNKMTWKSLLSFVLGQFNKQWSDAEQNIIKPSSWLNSMLPELLFDGGESKAIFILTSRKDFLTAVFRGGGERIQFVYSLLNHIRSAYPEYSQIISRVENSQLATEDMFARLILITHAIQSKAFSRSMVMMNSGDHSTCDYQELLTNPTDCVSLVSNTLQLGLTNKEINISISNKFNYHSKITSRSASQNKFTEVNRQVNKCYQQNFCRALDWAEKNLQESCFV